MGLIRTPNRLYDLLGGRYLMFVPSSNLIVRIWFVSRLVLALLIGFAYLQRASVASHLQVSSSRPGYLLKRCSSLFWIFRFSGVLVVILMSPA